MSDTPKATATAAWADRLREVHLEAAGVVSLAILRPEDTMGLVLAAGMGDAAAGWLARGLIDALRQIRSAPRRKPSLCACCPRVLIKRPFSIAMAIPERDDPTKCIVFGICQTCAVTPDAIRGKAVEALKRIFPEIRPISIHPQGGRA